MKKPIVKLAALFVGVLLEALLLCYWQVYTFPAAKTAAAIAGKESLVFITAVIGYLVTTVLSALIPVVLYLIITGISANKEGLVAPAPKTQLAMYYYVNCLFVTTLTLVFTYFTHNAVPAVATMAVYYGGVIIQLLLSYSVFGKRRGAYGIFAIVILVLASIQPIMQLLAK